VRVGKCYGLFRSRTDHILVSGFYAGLYNGGPVSLVYGFILAFFGTLSLAASLAEMASM